MTENDQLQKQMRILRAKKAASKERATRGKTLDESQQKEVSIYCIKYVHRAVYSLSFPKIILVV